MKRNYYQTESGALIPAVTEDEMHAVDRIAVEEYQLGILQMMENAGRNLAKLAGTFIKEATQKIVILAGTGGNGGGGLCCARHLLNHGYRVDIILVKEPGSYQSAAGTQLKILQASNANIFQASSADSILASAHLIIDALIGYSLKGAPKGSTEDIIRRANQSSLPILSLDLPSGMDATRGDSPGISIQADTVMTLALPKMGLTRFHGRLFLADIGIPHQLYDHLGLKVSPFPPGKYIEALDLQT